MMFSRAPGVFHLVSGSPSQGLPTLASVPPRPRVWYNFVHVSPNKTLKRQCQVTHHDPFAKPTNDLTSTVIHARPHQPRYEFRPMRATAKSPAIRSIRRQRERPAYLGTTLSDHYPQHRVLKPEASSVKQVHGTGRKLYCDNLAFRDALGKTLPTHTGSLRGDRHWLFSPATDPPSEARPSPDSSSSDIVSAKKQ